jgi:hypothetical protein
MNVKQRLVKPDYAPEQDDNEVKFFKLPYDGISKKALYHELFPQILQII